MAIINKINFTDFQDAKAPSDVFRYKNHANHTGKWVQAKLVKRVVPQEGDVDLYYLLFEITAGAKIGFVDAPEPPFGTGNGPA